MRKLYKFIALIATLVVTLTVGIIGYKLFSKPTVWLSTSSPNKTYTVELTGNKGRGGFIIYAVVRHNVIKHGQTIIKDALTHYGDSMDISFELAYPEYAWVDENVIRFWRNPDRPEQDKTDTLLVSNDTDKTIRYLKINTKDMFFIFDIQPRTTLKLSFSRQPEGNHIGCEGEFDDGQQIGSNWVSFQNENKLHEPLRYCMSVNYDRVKIESPLEEGYGMDTDWKNPKPNVPKATNCNP